MSGNRITSPDMTLSEVVYTLSDGNPGAITVLTELVVSNPLGILELFLMDSKRLYGSRIWELYKNVCGKDLERFKYHLEMELPNQETGVLTVTGPHSLALEETEFWAKRQGGHADPGSWWALKDHPTDPHYDYPIK